MSGQGLGGGNDAPLTIERHGVGERAASVETDPDLALHGPAGFAAGCLRVFGSALAGLGCHCIRPANRWRAPSVSWSNTVAAKAGERATEDAQASRGETSGAVQGEIWIGLDTGGTFTDAVALDGERRVIAAAKALTTHWDLSVGLGEAIRAVLDALPA